MVENASAACRIQADAILISGQQVIVPGQIVVSHGRIVDVTSCVDNRPDVMLDDCVLLPGLINPHTHLEFSDLAQPLPAGQHFPQWIQSVLAQRQQASLSELQRTKAITAGLNESRAAGVVAVGDIVTSPWQPQALPTDTYQHTAWLAEVIDEPSRELFNEHLYRAHRLPQSIAFLEQLGLSSGRREAMAAWREQVLSIDRSSWPESLIDLAISPHAPYSTPPELCQELSQLAARQHRLLAMHVLESPAEREWFDSGTGPMADMLAQFGAAGWRLPRGYIETLCHQLSQATSALLIHGNYLTLDELDCIAEYSNMSLVYCPRTHEHFGHEPYPLASILQRGIRLLIGTDSRSTNPDLNLWQDARTALRLHCGLRPTQAFSAITSSAATALGLQSDFGTLDVGRRAVVNSIRVKASILRDPERLLEHLFEAALHPAQLS